MSNALLRLYGTTKGFVQDRFDGAKDRGATMVEYGLLVGLISIVAIAAIITIGDDLVALFQNVATKLPTAAG